MQLTSSFLWDVAPLLKRMETSNRVSLIQWRAAIRVLRYLIVLSSSWVTSHPTRKEFSSTVDLIPWTTVVSNSRLSHQEPGCLFLLLEPDCYFGLW